MDEATQVFEAERARLISLCYRMLGERAAAEDVVQECWLRWAGAQDTQIDNPRAWLTRVASRIAIDTLRSARARRERYVGPWLPEPLVVSADNPAEDAYAQAQECGLALLWAMERLEPAERAAFILREALDTDYAEIARTLDKSQAACRKLVSRARRRVQEASPRFDVSPARVADLLAQFLDAAKAGDAEALKRLFATNALAISDGGPNARAARRPLEGPEEIVNVTLSVLAQREEAQIEPCSVNGMPGLLARTHGKVFAVVTLVAAQDGRITWMYTMVAPEKVALVN